MTCASLFLPIAYLLMGINLNPINNFEIPNPNTHYYRGQENGQRHTLTLISDTTFHLTVPNNSGSCRTWGEYGGAIVIKMDTITFHFEYIPINNSLKTIERFVIDSYQQMTRIGEQQFMFENYRLSKW